VIRQIEDLATRLVREAPELDSTLVGSLVAELIADGRPLARSLADVVGRTGAGAIDAGIALPAIAMACATLCDPQLGEREREAARYEIETLLPVPEGSKPPVIAAPDVPLTSVRKRRP
jgi:hypothetical protein